MENKENSKIKNFEKVRTIVKDFNSFTAYDIRKITNMNNDQVKRILSGLVEIGELKYSESTKIYVRL